MRRPVALISPFIAVSFYAVSCREKPNDTEISLRSADLARPQSVASAADAPEFVRSLSLLYPHAELFRVENKIVQKTAQSLADIVAYYQATFAKHGFAENTRLEQSNGALLLYDRPGKELTETISLDIQKLPYAESYLIRLTRSESEKPHGKKE